MASGPSQEVSVDVPGDLHEWLQAQAESRDVDPPELVAQLLASYHAAASLDGDTENDAGFDGDGTEAVVSAMVEPAVSDVVDRRLGPELLTHVERAVDEQVAEALPDKTADEDELGACVDDRIEERVEDAIRDRVEEAVDDRVEAALDERLEAALDERVGDVLDDHLGEALEERLGDTLDERLGKALDERLGDALDERLESGTGDRLDEVEAEFEELVQDVRDRVIQVKRETDGKAPADHDHESLLGQLDQVTDRVRDLASSLETLEAERTERVDALDARLDEYDATVEDVSSRIEETDEKLDRVAWVISDLRDDVASREARDQAVDRIKRAAAREGVSSAECESCGESVDIGLLTDPACPHCDATASDVRPVGGFLRTKAQLVGASQLEAGPETEEEDADE